MSTEIYSWAVALFVLALVVGTIYYSLEAAYKWLRRYFGKGSKPQN